MSASARFLFRCRSRAGFLPGGLTISLIPILAACHLGSTSSIQREGPPEQWIPGVYERADIQGSFAWMLHSEGKLHLSESNLKAASGWLPCSTFKIPNSILALEEGVIKDEVQVVKWDGVKRAVPAWNRDQDMTGAFRNSTVWFYQGIARKLSIEKYRSRLAGLHYGNGDFSAGLERFWLEGGFRVTHPQQIALLRGIDEGTLPVSKRTLDAVRRIMLVEANERYILRAKTGLGKDPVHPERPIGWWVGYVETPTDRLYFSNFVTADPAVADFPERRVAVAREILAGLGFQ